MTRTYLLAAFAVFMLLLPRASHATPKMARPGNDTTPGTIKITFVKQDKPVEGVEATLIRFTNITPEDVGTKKSDKDGVVRFENLKRAGNISYKFRYSYQGVRFPKAPANDLITEQSWDGKANVDVTFDKSKVEYSRRLVFVAGWFSAKEEKDMVRIEERHVLKNNAKVFFAGYDTPPKGDKAMILSTIPSNAKNVRHGEPPLRPSHIQDIDAGPVHPRRAIAPGEEHVFVMIYDLEYGDNHELSFDIDSPLLAKDFSLVTTTRGEILVTCDSTTPKTNSGQTAKNSFPMAFSDAKPGQKHKVRVKFLKRVAHKPRGQSPNDGSGNTGSAGPVRRKHAKKGPPFLLIGLLLFGGLVIVVMIVIKMNASGTPTHKT